MSLDLEKEYNNRAAVPEHPAVIARWAAESKAYRNINPPRVIEYGPGAGWLADTLPCERPA